MYKTTFMGIERTVSDLISGDSTKRVNGVIKFLAEDFHVHEINVNGEILNVCKYVPLEKISRAMEHMNRVNTGEDFLRKYDSSFVFPETMLTDGDFTRLRIMLDMLKGLLLKAKMSEEGNDSSAVDQIYSLHICKVKEDMKSIRTGVHNWVREYLPFLESKSLNMKSIRKDENMMKYLEPYNDEFASLDDNYNIVHISPKPVCLKKIRSKWNIYKDSEGAQSYDESLQQRHDNLVKNDSDTPIETVQDLVKEVDCTDYSNWSSNYKDNVRLRKYLHFTMLKMNRDTSEVVNMLCKCSKRASFDVFTAGNKDRRAITVQRMCMRRSDISEMFETMSKKGWFKDVYLSDFVYSDERLHLGELSGNFFKVVVRGLDVPPTDTSSASSHTDDKCISYIIDTRVNYLREYGFINYFGLQRFGSMLVGTHIVGAAIIKHDYESAVRLILGDVESAKSFPWFEKYLSTSDAGMSDVDTSESVVTPLKTSVGSSDPERKYKRAVDYYLKDNDAKSALEFLPKHLYIEKSLLKGLDEKLPFDKCLGKIPKNILSIYVHATQSLIFNKAVSERLSKFGYEPVVGDLVSTGVPDEDEEEGDEVPKNNKRRQIIEITNEDEVKRYSINQVVLPLPGDDVQYPPNMVETYKKTSLEEFGIPLEMFSTCREKSKRIVSIGGSYRFIVVRPRDVSYRLIEPLKNPFEILVPSPISQSGLGNIESILKDGSKYAERMNRISKELVNKRAVVLTCSLPKSSYITMAIREVFTDKTIENL
ncbi:conserved hypothetical protein [Theileria equi strain WA]|uniref:TRUD domain-containing protein n=1 Tax=Theileria equi strain WA TaxID=1537102 RepID=L1LDX5_THEEQ|nr:conserved hypothetical protein [Theileria equi strain WA]EKX73450.1 conserved hypothetical protein [Theileria equi strain WA]|eukprot:XP_004832902.1 conserved hypothetical protein [Theileria equi strain WA]